MSPAPQLLIRRMLLHRQADVTGSIEAKTVAREKVAKGHRPCC
jgi:hypothetical protein